MGLSKRDPLLAWFSLLSLYVTTVANSKKGGFPWKFVLRTLSAQQGAHIILVQMPRMSPLELQASLSHLQAEKLSGRISFPSLVIPISNFESCAGLLLGPSG